MSQPQRLLGKPVADAIEARLRVAVADLPNAPRLVALLANDREESRVYLAKKGEAAARVGLAYELVSVPLTERTTEIMIARVRALNADPDTHGVIIQLPLAEPIDADRVLERLDPLKDVDGLHPTNIGGALLAFPGLRPATAKAIVSLLQYYRIPLDGQHVVVVGASRIVGRPLIGMLLAEGATVTVCHDRTRALDHHTRRADVLVVAAGHPNLITGDMVRSGVHIVDAGWTWVNGRPQGDVAQSALEQSASYSPVPGGVGPVTIAELLGNTVVAYRLQMERPTTDAA